MSKAADAFRTIAEVAEDLKVPKHVLRFWEVKFPQIKPMKRGGGRRYYRPEDLDLLRGIHRLLHVEGYTIRGVQKKLRSEGIDQVKATGLAAVDAVAAKGKASMAKGEGGARLPAKTGEQRAIDGRTRLSQLAKIAEELEAVRAILAGQDTAVRRPKLKRRGAGA